MCMKGGLRKHIDYDFSRILSVVYKELMHINSFFRSVRWFPINGERSAFSSCITLTLKASENFLNSHLQTGHKLSCFLDCFLLRFVFEKHIFCY